MLKQEVQIIWLPHENSCYLFLLLQIFLLEDTKSVCV